MSVEADLVSVHEEPSGEIDFRQYLPDRWPTTPTNYAQCHRKLSTLQFHFLQHNWLNQLQT